MAFLFLTLAFSMAIATFVESSYGTPAARSLVYNALWFELLWGLFALNLVNNLFRYRLLTKRRFTMGLFHLAFIVMLIGAAITRFFGYEGTMHIRENSSTDYLLSTNDYFYAGFDGQEEAGVVQFSEFTPNQFSAKFDVNGRKVKVKSEGFISDAERKPVPAQNGKPVIDFVFATPDQQGMQSFIFSEGDLLEYPGFNVGFETAGEPDIRFFRQGGELFMVSKSSLEETTMSSGEAVRLAAGDTIPVKPMFLYNKDDFRFLMRGFFPSASFTAAKSQSVTNDDAVMIEISDGIRTQSVPVFGHSGVLPDTVEVPLGDNTLKLAYGARKIPLSFQLHLEDFQLERYPGSNSPSSFASEVVLIDEEKGVQMPYRIFMNNILDYDGYRFFQSSFDKDEKGTYLSVNHDFWGTWISYISYFMLAVGFVLSLVNKNSYFRVLIRRLQNESIKTAAVVMLVAGFSLSVNAQDEVGATIPKIDEEVVNEFSELWVQGVDGRIEPMSTLSSEIVRKVSRKSSLYGRSPDEVVLSMMTYTDIWQSLPIVRVSDKELAKELGVDGKYISVQQLFDAQGNYRIAEQVQAAYAKTPAFRNRIEKEYIYVDERVSICFMVFRASIFHIYPRDKKEDTWYAPGENAVEYSGGDSIFIKNGFSLLLQSIDENNTGSSLQVLGGIENFQQKFGAELLPSETKKDIEILYNKVNPFERVFPFYLLFGFLLLFVLLVNIFRLKPLPRWLKITFSGLIVLLFLIHTVGLIARWYISGHAPWSNGYESVVYVAWAAMLAGLIFGRKYPMVIGTAAFLSGISLFVAHLSWMNPEVTNLVPVLKSYWLTIHVSIITASYGFLGLSAFLGILVLILIVLRTSKNQHKVNIFINQLTTINEMSATVGLYALTIGTFLGGVWANESWGRYWGWDPKETWSLITVVIYSFIVHMRLIPSLKGVFNYNMASVIGFASVMMTYFGVNYYLSGLHSYGKGVADGVNPAVPVSFAVLAGLMIWAYIKDLKYEKQSESKV